MPTYLALLAFLVFMSVLIAAYFYLAWVKARDARSPWSDSATQADQPSAQEVTR